MEDAITEILINRIKEVETWVLLVLFILFWFRKEYKDFKLNKKSKYTQSEINEKLSILTNGYSNTLSKDSTSILFKLVFTSCYCKVVSFILNNYKGKSFAELKQKLANEISIINDEHSTFLDKYKYSGSNLNKYIPDEILSEKVIIDELNELDFGNMNEVVGNFRTRLTLSANKIIEQL